MTRKHQLGQHFLINTQVAHRQITYATLQPDDIVLEIGPGKGILTKQLAQQAKQVITIEIDPRLVATLKQRLPENVHLIQGDAMKIDYSQLLPFTKIVANLPYHISSPITFKLLQYRFKKAILMYQKDFADRMIATPGTKDYSRLSVGVYYKTHCRILEIVPRTCFSPQPQIESAIVELIPREQPPFHVPDEAFFFEITKRLFTHRRKTIKNSLEEAYGPLPNHMPYQKRRVEELTPEEIGELSTRLQRLLTGVR